METRSTAPDGPRGFRLAVGALLAATVAVSAQIVIPVPPVPFTLQTAMTGLVGLILPPGEAFMAMLVYLGLGAIGLPVFAGFKGGVGVLAGPTGGFLLAFPLQVAATSWLLRSREGLGRVHLLACQVPGLLLVYLVGWGGLQVFGGFDPAKATAIVLPFLPGAAGKILVAAEVYRQVAPRLPPPYRRS